MGEWLHKFGALAGILSFILAGIVADGNKEFRCHYGLGLKSDECPNTKPTPTATSRVRDQDTAFILPQPSLRCI